MNFLLGYSYEKACTVIKAERIALICSDKIDRHLERKKTMDLNNYWIIWRDGTFDFGCSWLMVVSKMGQLFYLVAAIISIRPASRFCQVMLIIQRYTNADLKISLYVCVRKKTVPWKFRILNPNNSWVIYPWNSYFS